MVIGVPMEIKSAERRVALTPSGAAELARRGHEVVVQTGAGAGAGFPDEDYGRAGARLGAVDEVFEQAELILKVKEPQPDEIGRIGDRHILFTYLHLAADAALAEALCASGATCIAYETVEERGSLPLLAPMSEVAGRLAVQEGARVLTAPGGGRGMLIGGVPGVAPAHVVVIGGGVAGTAAARVAAGMGARVTILDTSNRRLWELGETFRGRATVLRSTAETVAELLPTADLVVGAVLVAGARAPHVIGRDELALMRPGTVLVDISIDQGGCFETSRPTTHADPTYEVDGIVHYCVTNMPGATPLTSTLALTNATFEHVVRLADDGRAAFRDARLATGLNVDDGVVVHRAVASALPASVPQVA